MPDTLNLVGDRGVHALAAIQTRASAIRLSSPGPTAAQLEILLRAAARAPDHGRLSPWRFVVLQGAARERLGAAMVESLQRRLPEASADLLAKEAAKPLRAPTIVAVAARAVPGRIPEIEQVLAVGAAVQNMLLAAHALGLGAVWKTGEAAYDPAVKQAIGLEPTDHLVAFVYLGAQDRAPPLRDSGLEGLVTWL